MKYIKTLDALRAVAVLIVVFHHLPIVHFDTPFSIIFNGVTGVDVFFVLSGFLISTILIHSKNKTNNILKSLKTFYMRRFLRIFPLYYSVIIVLYILNPHNYRNDFIYDLLYISNFYMGIKGDFTSVTPHFWSLAVEEQFYLFWPILIFLTPKNKEWIIFSLVFLIGIFSYVYYEKNNPFYGARTFINLSYLAAGGLWAYIKIHHINFSWIKPVFLCNIFFIVRVKAIVQ